jgi:sugar transferase (PEP-CTERM system associated)
MVRVFSHYISAKLVLLVGLEALVLTFSICAGFAYHHSDPASIASFAVTVPPPAAAFSLGMLIVMSSMGLYQFEVRQDEQPQLGRLIAAGFLGLGFTILITRSVPSLYLGPGGLAITVVMALVGSAAVRFTLYKLDSAVTFKPRVLVLGTGSRVMALAERAQRNYNHTVVGYVSLQPSSSHYVSPLQVLSIGQGESLLSIVEKHGIDQIVIAVRDRRGGGLPVQDLLKCRLKGVKITELATFFEREYRQVLLDSLNPSWMVLGDGFRQGGFRTIAKRIFDLIASLVLLLLSLPILCVAALCIIWESGFPVLYRQERVGLGGRKFTIYKLRSMWNGAESDGIPRWANAGDERTTRTGKIIRKLRIDELPQIMNVFKGDMSFVGPRPERPYFVEQLEKRIPYYSLRHSVKPGITGWAQVRYSYGASEDDAVEKLQYDLYYVKNHSLFLDLVVLINTIEVVLWNRGAR